MGQGGAKIIAPIKQQIFKLIDEYDNSYHHRVDPSFLDAAICAGTPEWRGKRMKDFYRVVCSENLPLYILGVGSLGKFKKSKESDLISKSKVLTFRTQELRDQAIQLGLGHAEYVPCPALLSATKEQEKKWRFGEDKIIGLGFNIPSTKTVPNIGISEEAYKYCLELFENIIRKYSQKNCRFVGICHYIDELPDAVNFFGSHQIPVLYSYDSKDYFRIYSQIDCLVTSRVHGCGICSSLGIPSLGICHDRRGPTINGFNAETVFVKDGIKIALNKLSNLLDELDARHDILLTHKHNVENKYLELLQDKIY